MPVEPRNDALGRSPDTANVIAFPAVRSTARWVAEGLSAAMQGCSRFENPYRFHCQATQHDAWIDGFLSFQR